MIVAVRKYEMANEIAGITLDIDNIIFPNGKTKFLDSWNQIFSANSKLWWWKLMDPYDTLLDRNIISIFWQTWDDGSE